ncbi:type II toxin-antitoxin system RelE/ParE family toxin [Alicyclobacillus macrosporangiidus]|uniref:mRNA interferase RelE/StbE n=1 Tax=Alicyclobacillus macrosporangiidus TaxID=392015 RepID=A0A1I7KDS2_9BACL|nr:type II toxin-antitoxin system RelE/ParE family toxin [Alicyclobacillus macrosporangiidus]SFU95592.1 mRNA interferase RelE/StbE [Alicyclobacillus macrosporangiidus]
MPEYQYKLSSRAKRVLKKIKDKALLCKYRDAMRDICESPYEGDPKVGDLSGLFTVTFRYVDGAHRIAYTVVEEEDTEPFVLVLLVGTRENFYEELKRIWKEQ